MTRLPQIWRCIKAQMPVGEWVSLKDIYQLVERSLTLDQEDYIWQSPTSNIPKWKRNVRNVLQYRKHKGELEWDGQANYRLP